ncbi:SDR family oxidoreductase [Actinomadura opuntiae]|uniref:SDR family oxidoreductase n=1 Tax=Actinomadura sp. OS1-43 TaxID=604315 RepID=UPI00255A7BD2|nr:SDR family oxidoreductase [Actinomadura sp. OS1-43]MDL4815606.1 SDR family oxidoreductase [Actinomadura sp. OS1-43]
MATVALVTGANRGLGRETARQLARRGMTVLLGSRDADRGARAARDLAGEGDVRPLPVDVTDPSGVAAAAERIGAEHGRLDVLVNNAGVMVEAPAVETTADDLRRAYEINVFGVVTVLNALLPLLRRSPAARVVNVSSTTASLTLTGGGTDFGGDAHLRLAYSSSKAALNMLTVQYAAAFAADPGLAHIKINSATPGYVATDMSAYRGTRTVEEGSRVVVELATLPADGPTGGFFREQGAVPW